MSLLDISYVFIDRKARYKPIYITQAYRNIPKNPPSPIPSCIKTQNENKNHEEKPELDVYHGTVQHIHKKPEKQHFNKKSAG
jgi:hypothetical protein